MKPLRFTLTTLAFAIAFAAVAGCASAPFKPDRAKPATLAQLTRLGAAFNGLDILLYKGSDAQFHYFHHSKLGGGGTYRLPRGEWKPSKEFPLGQADEIARGVGLQTFQRQTRGIGEAEASKPPES